MSTTHLQVVMSTAHLQFVMSTTHLQLVMSTAHLQFVTSTTRLQVVRSTAHLQVVMSTTHLQSVMSTTNLQVVMSTTHLHQKLRLRMNGGIPPLPIHTLIACARTYLYLLTWQCFLSAGRQAVPLTDTAVRSISQFCKLREPTGSD